MFFRCRRRPTGVLSIGFARLTANSHSSFFHVNKINAMSALLLLFVVLTVLVITVIHVGIAGAE
jgi:hypothetical protein